MKPIIAAVVVLFVVPMLLVLCLLAFGSKTARKALRVVVALIAALVLVDELKELFASKPVARALEVAQATAEQTPAAKALAAALAAGGKVA